MALNISAAPVFFELLNLKEYLVAKWLAGAVCRSLEVNFPAVLSVGGAGHACKLM